MLLTCHAAAIKTAFVWQLTRLITGKLQPKTGHLSAILTLLNTCDHYCWSWAGRLMKACIFRSSSRYILLTHKHFFAISTLISLNFWLLTLVKLVCQTLLQCLNDFSFHSRSYWFLKRVFSLSVSFRDLLFRASPHWTFSSEWFTSSCVGSGVTVMFTPTSRTFRPQQTRTSSKLQLTDRHVGAQREAFAEK